LLCSLNRAELEGISRRARCGHLERGEVLFRQGDTAERFYLVVKGHIKLYRLSPEGKEKVVKIVAPGATFAESLTFSSRPRYPLSAAAIDPVDLVGIEFRGFARVLRSSVDACFRIMEEMSVHLRTLVDEIDKLHFQSANCRVADYLLRRAKEEGDLFNLGVPKLVIASVLSVAPETLSRALRDLNDRNVIQRRGRKIQVLDRVALKDAAERESAW